MKIEIQKINGKWFVNGKQYAELDWLEKVFFQEFLAEMKYEFETEKR